MCQYIQTKLTMSKKKVESVETNKQINHEKNLEKELND